MKELDFDELDRAVSSLMTNTGTSAPKKSDEKVLTIDSTLDANEIPVFPSFGGNDAVSSATTPVTTPEPSDPPEATSQQSVPSTTPSPAARRGGRFMDVVHPSSDMKTAELPNRVSREGTTIATPTASPVSEPATPDLPASQGDEATSPEPEPETPASSWPDPIDFHMAKDTPPAEDEHETETEEASTPVEQPEEKPVTEDTPEESSAPLQSPFLTDAKVEKRPLGAFASVDTPSSDVTAETSETTSETEPTDTTDSQLPEDTTPLVLPDELKGDIVAIEADNSAVEPEPTPSVEPASQSIATAVSLGSTSIKQQYKEEPSTTPADHAPIFDTPAYNQPLAHPAKKKSGWFVVLLIILLIVVGAGIGAALYFFVLR